MKLTDDAESLITNKVDQLIKEHQDALLEQHRIATEQKFWLVVFRFLFAIVLGGSIYGFVNIDSYIDGRVANRIGFLDQLPIAISQAEGERWEDALTSLDNMWSEVIDENKISNNDFTQEYFYNYIWVLGNIELYEGELDYNDWVKNQWTRIKKHHLFKSISNSLSDDVDYQWSIAKSELKFAPSKRTLERSITRLKIAEDETYNNFESAHNHYLLALLYILNDEIGEAEIQISLASDLHPAEYLVNDWESYKASFTGSSDHLMWVYIAKKLSIVDFDDRLDKAFKQAIKLSESHE